MKGVVRAFISANHLAAESIRDEGDSRKYFPKFRQKPRPPRRHLYFPTAQFAQWGGYTILETLHISPKRRDGTPGASIKVV
jgi:hypothetical protein